MPFQELNKPSDAAQQFETRIKVNWYNTENYHES